MKTFDFPTLNIHNMERAKKIEGTPQIRGVPCIWDRYYKFSSAEFLGLAEWLCPHCYNNLSWEGDNLVCLQDCHKEHKLIRWGEETND